jgi:HNH endonuclease
VSDREGRSKRIAKQLGMSHGSALSKLRKSILFSFIKRLNEDICSRCQKKIDSVDELSIEHVEPWENRSPELFWDLNNIKFSHLKCNRPHKNHGWAHINNKKF